MFPFANKSLKINVINHYQNDFQTVIGSLKNRNTAFNYLLEAKKNYTQTNLIMILYILMAAVNNYVIE